MRATSPAVFKVIYSFNRMRDTGAAANKVLLRAPACPSFKLMAGSHHHHH